MTNELRLISDPISMHIWASLHNYAYKEAIFAAERLFAETKSEECLFLLATCFYRMGRPKQAIRILNAHEYGSGKVKYLLARCFFDCSMLSDAENTLLGPKRPLKCINDIAPDFGDQTCYALLLLGDIYRLQQNYADAAFSYRGCLSLNPLMWTAYESLCSIGQFIDPDEAFSMNSNISLFMPTFPVAGTTVAMVKSPVNVHVKAERDRLGSRENVNPNSPTKDTPNVPDIGNEKILDVNTTDIIKTNYLSQFTAMNPDFSNAQSILPDDLATNFTPGGLAVSSTTPHAPNINREDCRPKKKLIGDNLGPIGFDSTPSFGVLSMVTQSPMFACVPVFSRQDVTTFMSTSIVGPEAVQPSRLALHQTTVNRQRTTRQAPTNSNQLQNVILFNNSIIAPYTQWRTKDTKASTPMATAPPVSLTGSVFGSFCQRPSVIPPWLAGSPIAANTSSILAAANTPAINNNALTITFPTAKAQILDDFDGANSPCPLYLHATPMDVGDAGIDTSPTSESGLHAVEPRTRAQKARAAASMGQRRSPRLSRISKPAVDGPQMEAIRPSCAQSPTNATNCDTSDIAPINDVHKIAFNTTTDPGDPMNESIVTYLQLLRRLGRSFRLLTQHDYKMAVNVLVEISPEQLATGKVLAWSAQAHFDAADYPKAKRIFDELRKLEPWQLYGMDVFSTVLWYLQAERELSQLANDLLNLDRSAPEPWSVTGNCFSLQREHGTAIRLFRRALQVCPTSAYACSLLGHEYMAMENLERAVAAFRHALRLDERNYSARFGLSNVYFKQEYFGLADAHLVRALSLFPNSCLLLTHLGAIRSRVGRLDDGPGSALDCLNKAVAINPNSAIALYHRACVLSTLGRYQDSIDELERLIQLTPREAMIYFMLGHAYQKIGNAPQAMIYYSWSMELDPKGVNTNLRDIMTNAPPYHQPALTPFTCTTAATPGSSTSPAAALSTAAATDMSPLSNSVPSRRQRRGGGVSRRSTRGARQLISDTAAAIRPARLFLNPSFQESTLEEGDTDVEAASTTEGASTSSSPQQRRSTRNTRSSRRGQSSTAAAAVATGATSNTTFSDDEFDDIAEVEEVVDGDLSEEDDDVEEDEDEDVMNTTMDMGE